MKKWIWIGCCLFACLEIQAQSAWRIFPEEAEVARKKLRNTCISYLYNYELQIERVHVVNNRMLQLRLRCPSRSLEYRGEVMVKKRSLKNGRFYEFATVKPEEPLFFLQDETIQIGFDLSSFALNGEYILTFQLHTELGETYFVEVDLNTEEFVEKDITELITPPFPDFEELRDDENHVYSFIKHLADFPGGQEGLVRFLKKNVNMDSLSADGGWDDVVYVGMIIEKDGSILYPEVVMNSGNRELDAEAMRLVNMMPQWKPGTIDGVKVRNRVLVRIWFNFLERSCIVIQ